MSSHPLDAPVRGYVDLELRGFIFGSGLVFGLEKISTGLHLASVFSCAGVGNLHLRRAQCLETEYQSQSFMFGKVVESYQIRSIARRTPP